MKHFKIAAVILCFVFATSIIYIGTAFADKTDSTLKCCCTVNGGTCPGNCGCACASCKDWTNKDNNADTEATNKNSKAEFKTKSDIIDFKLPDTKGKTHTLSALNTKDILIVKFGATWCPPCNAITPVLEKVEKDYKDKVRVVTVFLNEDIDTVKDHKNNTKDSLIALVDEDGKYGAKYNISSIPAVYIYKNSKLVNNFVGYRDYGFFKKTIDKLLINGDNKD